MDNKQYRLDKQTEKKKKQEKIAKQKRLNFQKQIVAKQKDTLRNTKINIFLYRAKKIKN